VSELLANLDIHPLRGDFYDELHSRPFQILPSPARVSHIAVLTNPEQRQSQFQHLQTLYTLLGHVPPQQEVGCFEHTFGDLRVRREMHMEFASYTFVNLAPNRSVAFSENAINLLPEGWLAELSGTVIAAFHLDIQRGSADRARENPDYVRTHFEGLRLIGSSPQEGAAKVWSTFQLHSDGFGRFMVINHKMSNSQLGRLTQRLMEIEIYRLMSLLALPVAREITPSLNDMDQQLVLVTQTLAENQDVDEQALLTRLTYIAARIEAFRARATFRFSATRAYHQLVMTRLDELKEDELTGHLTLTEFLTRRLTPAVKTCEAVGERLEDLSRRVDRASDMMRTRVELAIQSQNQQLLSSMDRRSKIQLMMQHTVEGFSVVAITYYLIGLLKLVLNSVYEAGIVFNKSLVLGIAIPVTLALVYLSVRLVHHHFIRMAKNQ
jgi:uncharacterized membrane-anchored protein